MRRLYLFLCIAFSIMLSSFYLYKMTVKTKSISDLDSSAHDGQVIYLIGSIKDFVNQYYKDFIPYAIKKNQLVIDKTEYVRNIATMYDIMQLQLHFYSREKSIYGINSNILNKINENAGWYLSIYKKNPSSMRQASAFLALLLKMFSKVKYENDIKQITDNLYQQIDALEPQFELGEVLMALSILNPKKDILNDQINKIIKKIEKNLPSLDDIFQYNWLSKFILVYHNDNSRRLFTILCEKVKNVLQLFTYEEETNYLAVAFECLASLLLYDKSIDVVDLIKILTEKLIKRQNHTYGLFEFKNGDMRLDITGHIINGFICLDKLNEDTMQQADGVSSFNFYKLVYEAEPRGINLNKLKHTKLRSCFFWMLQSSFTFAKTCAKPYLIDQAIA